MADFDSLAAAVGLAKLWQDERTDDGERRGGQEDSSVSVNGIARPVTCF